MIASIQMNNKVDKPKRSFYKLIQSVVADYQFEIASKSNSELLKHNLYDLISQYYPKVNVVGNIEVDFSAENYSPTLNISKILIKEMELHYPEAMI